jgi:hypothetical protein
MSVVERWLTELGVGWVLSLEAGAGASAGKVLDDHHARSWIRALDQIAQTICFTSPLFPDRVSVGLPSICDEEGEPVAEKSLPDRYHFALFIQETMLKVLVFLDVLVALDPNKTEEFLSVGRDEQLPYTYSLFNLLGVHDVLSEASNKILTLFDSPTSVEVQRIENEVKYLWANYSSVTTYIRYLWANYSSVTTYIRYLWANYTWQECASY